VRPPPQGRSSPIPNVRAAYTKRDSDATPGAASSLVSAGSGLVWPPARSGAGAARGLAVAPRASSWSAMKVRIARHTERLDEVVAFYRDRVGLPEVGRFSGHDGYDGVFLDIPGTGAHLELTSGGGHRAPRPHPESVLVLYFDDQLELDAVAESSSTTGTPRQPVLAEERAGLRGSRRISASTRAESVTPRVLVLAISSRRAFPAHELVASDQEAAVG
jgi:hypothetical protein